LSGVSSLRLSDLCCFLGGMPVETLRHGGNVLVPIDTAARVLEVMLLLDQYWSYNRLRNYPIVFLSHTR
jgi:cleavage and polyadenylation specificity factor subunit 2